MMDGPILVTGAGGFVCSEIALSLSRAGHKVTAVDQLFDEATAKRLKNVRRIQGPLSEVLADRDLGSYSAVIHGAAITASPEQLDISKAAHIRRNMDMLTSTLDFAHKEGANRFLFLSSMGVFQPYDLPASHGCFTEVTRPSATCAYCAAKKAGELLTTAAADHTFTTSSLRLGNVFGSHEALRETRQRLCLVSRMISEAKNSGVIEVQSPQAQRDWSWLPDLADAIVQLIQNLRPTSPNVLHAGTPPVIKDLMLARAIAHRVNGTTIRLVPSQWEANRPPMASGISSIFDGIKWTSIESALDSLIPTQAMR